MRWLVLTPTSFDTAASSYDGVAGVIFHSKIKNRLTFDTIVDECNPKPL